MTKESIKRGNEIQAELTVLRNFLNADPRQVGYEYLKETRSDAKFQGLARKLIDELSIEFSKL